MDEIVEQARKFAYQRHGFGRRKHEDGLHTEHLERVVALLRDYGYDAPAILAAAYLHDTVEKASVSLAEIAESFGPDIGEIVFWLTDAPGEADPFQKVVSAWRLSRAPLAAKVIKLADLIDNTRTILAHDPAYAETYLAKKALILSHMARVEGDALTRLPLYAEARAGLGAESPSRA